MHLPSLIHVVMTGDEQKFAVQFNVLMDTKAMKGLETELKEKLASLSRGGDISTTMDQGAPQSATLRFPSSTMESQQEVMAGLQKVTINGKKLKISPPGTVVQFLLYSYPPIYRDTLHQHLSFHNDLCCCPRHTTSSYHPLHPTLQPPSHHITFYTLLYSQRC